MVAASGAVRELLTAPARPATVLAAFPSAVYLQVDEPSDGVRAVVGLLARDAARLPLGVVVAQDAACGPFAGIAAGDPGLVGDGVVQVTAGAGQIWRWQVRRWWDARVPVVRRFGPHPGPEPSPRLDEGRLDAAVRGLIGLGPGLTPAGDDVLCGALAALTALGDTGRRDRLAAAVDRHAHRTTALSAALLRAAAAGHGLPELTRLLVAVLRDEPPETTRAALTALLAIGHTSGAALAAGAWRTLSGVARGPVAPRGAGWGVPRDPGRSLASVRPVPPGEEVA